MLSKEENEYLTRVGRGTPMGELFRRFWLPALLSSELPTSDCPPKRLRLLGEDLVSFRDTNSKVGIIEAYCAHKLANLYWARNEECGLRCTYHGWKYDTEGNCVDMPNEPAESNFKNKIKLTSYPTREKSGVVWVYMGPADKMPPELPGFEWIRRPDDYAFVTKWLQRTNWAQGMEGEIDSSHISFLHSFMQNYQGYTMTSPTRIRAQKAQNDGSPRLTLREREYGFSYGARRKATDGDYYWRVTRWLYPFYSLIPEYPGTNGRCWVPIDDNHTWTFAYDCRIDRPYTPEERAQEMRGVFFPPRMTYGTYTLPDGYIIDTWLPIANRENDYLINRDMQRTVNYTGIWGGNEQDRSIQEAMGHIVDRSREHLGTTDIASISARRLLIKMARNLENGIEPEIIRNPDAYGLRALDVLTPIEDFDSMLSRYEEEIGLARI